MPLRARGQTWSLDLAETVAGTANDQEFAYHHALDLDLATIASRCRPTYFLEPLLELTLDFNYLTDKN